MTAWWIGLACAVCGRRVLTSGKSEPASFHHPHDGRPPYAVHGACREEAEKR